MTEHFRAEEFASKDGAAYPARWLESRLRPLCEVLEVIRAAWGAPLKVMSGYRSPARNAAVSGARNSQHMEGRAADLQPAGKRTTGDVARLHALCLRLHTEGVIRLGGLGEYPGFVHVDIRPGERLARWGGSRVQADDVA